MNDISAGRLINYIYNNANEPQLTLREPSVNLKSTLRHPTGLLDGQQAKGPATSMATGIYSAHRKGIFKSELQFSDRFLIQIELIEGG